MIQEQTTQTQHRFQLSKSRYVEGTICQKRLWLQYHHRELAAEPSLAEQRTMNEGTRVGMNARELLFPDGVLIHQIGTAALAETQDAMAMNPSAIFEATFYYNGVLVMCDLLVNNYDGSWNLMEVKASTRRKPEYISDVAVQTYVVEGAGVQLTRQLLLLINNSEPICPDCTNLFVQEDVTDEVADALIDLPYQVADFHTMLQRNEAPRIAIGNHCQKPYQCPFKEQCWQEVPEPSIFSIPRLRGTHKSDLAQRGILRLADLPNDFPLAVSQQTAVRLMVSQSEEIDRAAIAKRLQTLVYPIYFFDFETDASAIPKYAGLKSYEAVPFQYSCHVLTAEGTLTHYEYLHTDQSDPRPQLLESLLNHIGPIGSVVVYNASFERGVLRKLAHIAPIHSAALESIIDRLWDQLEIFKHHYKSYRFGGSNSIKKVLPVVAPTLSYSELTVSRGDQAQAVWNEMTEERESIAKQQMIDDLLAYCKLDTLAMVEIQRHLEGICQPVLA